MVSTFKQKHFMMMAIAVYVATMMFIMWDLVR